MPQISSAGLCWITFVLIMLSVRDGLLDLTRIRLIALRPIQGRVPHRNYLTMMMGCMEPEQLPTRSILHYVAHKQRKVRSTSIGLVANRAASRSNFTGHSPSERKTNNLNSSQ